jgi:hypothetical protein
MIPVDDLLAQPLSSSVGGRLRSGPSRQILTTFTAITSNSWPGSISRRRGSGPGWRPDQVAVPVAVRVVSGRVGPGTGWSASAWAVLSARATFASIPYQPRWALFIITLRIFVIWALATHGRDVATDRH